MWQIRKKERNSLWQTKRWSVVYKPEVDDVDYGSVLRDSRNSRNMTIAEYAKWLDMPVLGCFLVEHNVIKPSSEFIQVLRNKDVI